MRTTGKQLLSILLCLCMAACMLPTVAFAADTGKAIQLGASNISGYDSTNGYDYIYYGTWSNSHAFHSFAFCLNLLQCMKHINSYPFHSV